MTDVAPWFDVFPEPPSVEPHIEAWARALCTVMAEKPDKIIGNPPLPRWRSYVYLAECVQKAAKIAGPIQ